MDLPHCVNEIHLENFFFHRGQSFVDAFIGLGRLSFRARMAALILRQFVGDSWSDGDSWSGDSWSEIRGQTGLVLYGNGKPFLIVVSVR